MATDSGVSSGAEGKIHVEVAFALPHEQRIVSLAVAHGTTARQAVVLAALETLFPEIPEDTFRKAPLGIFGTALRDPEHHELHEGDRVEVYRPLKIDPKVARAERAAKGAGR